MFRFTDDIAPLENTESELEEAFTVAETVFNNQDMKNNIGKTKAEACRAKSGKKPLKIKIGYEKIREISKFGYLKSKITRDGRCNVDIRSKIGQPKEACTK